MDIQSAAKLPFNLKILKTDENGVPKLALPFIAMFNPEQFAITETIILDTTTAKAKDGTDPKFTGVKPRTFTIDFTLDGTGVNTNGVKIPVTAQILLFRSVTTEIEGETHRPPYVLVQYGPFISSCILQSSTVTYTMFDMFGLPIRAKVSASFVERKVAALGNIVGMLSSPDLTHKIQVQPGDLLPLLTYKTYKNQNYYLQVARINKIKNFRKLVPGTSLIFPPIAKT